jgi:hypothetical protein
MTKKETGSHKQDRQSSYNVIMRHFRLTVYAVKNQFYRLWMQVYSLGYPACCAPYCTVFGGLSSSTVFSTLSHERHTFRKNVTGRKMCVAIFFTTSVWNISHYKKTWATYNHNVLKFSRKVPALLVRFQCKLNFSSQMLQKYSNIQFHENQSSESRVDPCGQRNTHTHMNEQTWQN